MVSTAVSMIVGRSSGRVTNRKRCQALAPSSTDASMIVPDVMIGASELLRLLTDEGGPVVLSSPTYNAFYGFLDAIGRVAEGVRTGRKGFHDDVPNDDVVIEKAVAL